MPRYAFIPTHKRRPPGWIRPATIVEELDPGFRYVVESFGNRMEMFTQPHTDPDLNPDVGDFVVARNVKGAACLFLPASRRIGGILYYSVAADEVGGATQAELWSYDDVTETFTKLWTSTYSWTDGEAHITALAWIPEVSLLYFSVHSADFDVANVQQNELFKYDPSDDSVTSVTTSFGSESSGGDTFAPPVYDFAYFKGDLYPVQGGGDPFISGGLPAAVYKLTIPGEVLTKQYDHPTVDTTRDRPSIAVYGDDAELLFCCYHNTINTGVIYSSLDGSSFSVLASLGINFELYNMMTDRDDGKVYIADSERGVGNYVHVYNGSTVSLDRTVSLGAESPFLGSRFTGSTRNDIWVFRESSQAGDDCEFKNGAWAAEDMGLTFSSTSGVESGNQFTAGYWGKMFFMAYGSTGIDIFQRVSGVWSSLITIDDANKQNHTTYRVDFCLCLGKTSILPHEQ